MQFNTTELSWVLEIELPRFSDNRGSFTRVFAAPIFEKEIGYTPIFRETFYSISQKDVIRGMHFQIPPSDQDKFVYVISGTIDDVVLDIRKDSPTYGQFIVRELSFENKKALFIPKWLAHGFLSKTENSIVAYMVSESWSPACDIGIRYDSFWYEWNTKTPIISEKDMNQILFSEFNSPF